MAVNRLIVIDSSHPLALNNQCFNASNARSGPGHWFYVRLGEAAERYGYRIVTSDIFLTMTKPSPITMCLSEMVTPRTDAVLSKGAQPAVCMSLESPLVAQKFYHNLVRYAGRFTHNFQFRGTRERLGTTGTTFHPIVFPMDTREPSPSTPWDERQFLALISSNKRAVLRRHNSAQDIAKTYLQRLRFAYYRLVDPWMRVREIYVDRIQAIYHFSHCTDFCLYGVGWDAPISGFGTEYQLVAQRVYAGRITGEYSQKRVILSRFKFSLCFENCAFPGYVTEKIFDCLLAGCIPVYFGAPDITDFVPADAFIDFRRFRDYRELESYLRNMSSVEGSQYLQAGRDFLASPTYMRYHQDTIIGELMEVFGHVS